MPPVASPASTWWRKASMIDSRPLAESVTEVRAAHGVVALERVRKPGQHDAAGLDDMRMVGELQGERGVLLDQQQADPLAPVDLAQDTEKLAHQQRREAEGRLVEQHE